MPFAIEYTEQYQPSPLSYWVHRQLDTEIWRDASRFEPPLPSAVPGLGYPRLVVRILGIELQFASTAEVEHFLEVLRQKNMPSSRRLSAQRGQGCGPNGHWLSRLPAKLKSWSKRERIIPLVEAGLKEFREIRP